MKDKFLTLLKQLLLILAVIVLGTIIDYFAHQTSPRFGVPVEYFRNKILFGTFWGFVGFLVFRRFTRDPKWLAVWVSLFVAIVLQTKYFLQGYDLFFVFLFLFLHFIMFGIPAHFLFKKYSELLLK